VAKSFLKSIGQASIDSLIWQTFLAKCVMMDIFASGEASDPELGSFTDHVSKGLTVKSRRFLNDE
jgi:hypothetical protein